MDEILDPEILEGLRELPGDGYANLLCEVADLFTKEAPPRLLELRQALAANDGLAVAQIAHRLKGSSANLGARQMSELCRQLEQQGNEGCLEGGEMLHADLEREYERVTRALAVESEK